MIYSLRTHFFSAGMIITLQLAYINIHLHTISAVTPGERLGSICVTSVASSRPHVAEVAGVDSERRFLRPTSAWRGYVSASPNQGRGSCAGSVLKHHLLENKNKKREVENEKFL